VFDIFSSPSVLVFEWSVSDTAASALPSGAVVAAAPGEPWQCGRHARQRPGSGFRHGLTIETTTEERMSAPVLDREIDGAGLNLEKRFRDG
jgi:hypothetical protein